MEYECTVCRVKLTNNLLSSSLKIGCRSFFFENITTFMEFGVVRRTQGYYVDPGSSEDPISQICEIIGQSLPLALPCFLASKRDVCGYTGDTQGK